MRFKGTRNPRQVWMRLDPRSTVSLYLPRTSAAPSTAATNPKREKTAKGSDETVMGRVTPTIKSPTRSKGAPKAARQPPPPRYSSLSGPILRKKISCPLTPFSPESNLTGTFTL